LANVKYQNGLFLHRLRLHRVLAHFHAGLREVRGVLAELLAYREPVRNVGSLFVGEELLVALLKPLLVTLLLCLKFQVHLGLLK